MDAVTYPDQEVIEFVETHMVPLRLPFDAQPAASDFKVTSTPTLVTLGPDGKEHHRSTGFMRPEELIPSLMLGIAKVHFDRDDFSEALTLLEGLLARFPKSSGAPEALFQRGVCRYRSRHDPKALKEAYERLQADYPASEWTKKASPYRLL